MEVRRRSKQVWGNSYGRRSEAHTSFIVRYSVSTSVMPKPSARVFPSPPTVPPTSMATPPVPEEMERTLAPPPILANMTFGGAVLIQGETGMLFSPMGMVTKEKVMQAICCPDW